MEIQRQIDRATNVSRAEALKAKNKDTIDRVPLVVTYHPDLPCLSKILQKHLPILHISNRMQLAVPNLPLVAYRRARNLKDLLVRAQIRPPQQEYKGTSRCGRPRCKTCSLVRTGVRFCSTTTKESFTAKVTATCKSDNVVYLIQCKRCGKQYVGETENPLHLRMNGHRSDYYRKLPDKPVAMHFNTSGHTFNDATVMVIEQMGVANSTYRKNRESYWIYTLRSVAPHGLNLDP